MAASPVEFTDLFGDTLLADILARDTTLGPDLRMLNLDQADRRILLLKLADAYREIDTLTGAEGMSAAADPDLWSTIEKLRAWVDTAENKLTGDAAKLVHALKVAEESGEVAQAAIGALGRNVRKGGVTHSWDDVGHELVDVIVTAMVALDAIVPGRAPQMFAERLAYIAKRAGIAEERFDD